MNQWGPSLECLADTHQKTSAASFRGSFQVVDHSSTAQSLPQPKSTGPCYIDSVARPIRRALAYPASRLCASTSAWLPLVKSCLRRTDRAAAATAEITGLHRVHCLRLSNKDSPPQGVIGDVRQTQCAKVSHPAHSPI